MKKPLWAAALALTALCAGPAPRAAVITFNGASCTYDFVTIDRAGNLTAQCAGTPTPSPTPTPAPTPAPTPTPSSCAGVNPDSYPVMVPAGRNDHTYNYPSDSITWRIRKADPFGNPMKGGALAFASEPLFNPIGSSYEVSISKCPGDFETYKQTPPTQGYYPCGHAPDGFVDFAASWYPGGGVMTCAVPENEQWYLNWRCTRGPSGLPCGQTFYWSPLS